LDLSRGTGAITFTNGISVDEGGTIYDPLNRMATNTDITPVRCTVDDVHVINGVGRTWRKTA
jgi:hypothetical protein